MLASCCVCVSSGLQTDGTTHQQCWKLLRLCWQWCANGCNNNQKCWGVVASVLAVVCKRMQQQPTMLRVVASVLAMVCKRMQQQPTMLGSCCVCVSSGLQTDATTHQQCWELLRPCWHRCANGPKNSQQCWDLQCIVRRIQLIWLWRPCVMRVRGPNNVGRAVQTDPPLLRYASAITEQKKCWELLARKFDRFQTLCNNPPQHTKRT